MSGLTTFTNKLKIAPSNFGSKNSHFLGIWLLSDHNLAGLGGSVLDQYFKVSTNTSSSIRAGSPRRPLTQSRALRMRENRKYQVLSGRWIPNQLSNKRSKFQRGSQEIQMTPKKGRNKILEDRRRNKSRTSNQNTKNDSSGHSLSFIVKNLTSRGQKLTFLPAGKHRTSKLSSIFKMQKNLNFRILALVISRCFEISLQLDNSQIIWNALKSS